jgi:hypothetical protein
MVYGVEIARDGKDREIRVAQDGQLLKRDD